MKHRLLLLILFFGYHISYAGDSIEIKINQLSFGANDSIHFSCRIHDYAARKLAATTLNVWIQDLSKKHTWKFRYPVLNGELDASLAIGDSIPPGKYAVNFILQSGLYRVQGTVRNNHTHNLLNYVMHLKGNRKLFNAVNLDANGNFLIKNILFEDRSFVVFTPEKKVKKNDLFITIATPLDSAFQPISIFTQLIDVKPELVPPSKVTPTYSFDFNETYDNTTLPEVTVYSKTKTKLDQYDQTYSTGLFQDDNARVFDGLENDAIANSLDIETFLIAHVPGLSVNRIDLGNYYFSWRNEPVAIYIDEFRMSDCEAINVSPSDVAMIKVFPPPASMNSGIPKSADGNECEAKTSGFSGAIAIYTKRGSYDNRTTSRFRFSIKGYNALLGRWQ